MNILSKLQGLVGRESSKDEHVFEDKDTDIKVAFDEADNVTHVCGLLPRLQHEKDRENITDENLTLSKVPNCLLSRAIAGLSPVSRNNMSKTGNVVHQGRTSPGQQQNSKAGDVAHQDRTVSMQQHIYKAKNVVHQRRAAFDNNPWFPGKDRAFLNH